METWNEITKGEAIMHNALKFAGYYLDKCGERHQYPSLLNPAVDEMLPILSLAKSQKAILGIRKHPEPEFGAFHLTVEIENENFLVMLQEYTEDGDIIVRMPFNPNGGDVKVEFFGDYWGSKSVLDDFEIVKAIFVEFLTTGYVSTDLLN